MATSDVPHDLADELLYKADMRCCVCGRQRGVQIHHIDADHSNNAVDNLIPLCVQHHSQASEKGGLGRIWRPSLLRRYRTNHFERVEKLRHAQMRLDAIVEEFGSQLAQPREEYNLGVVYQEGFGEFLKYCTQLDKTLRASIYREIQGLWTTEKGRLYLASNLGLLAKRKDVQRIFFLDHAEQPASYRPTVYEAIKHDLLGIDVRVVIRNRYREDNELPWDMFGVHDDRYLSTYSVQNETIFGGIRPSHDDALTAIAVYDPIFANGLSPAAFCEEFGIWPTPKEYETIEAEVAAVVEFFRKSQ